MGRLGIEALSLWLGSVRLVQSIQSMTEMAPAPPLPVHRQQPVYRMLGVPLNALTMQQVLTIVDDCIERKDPVLFGVVNAAKVVNMRRSTVLGDAVLSSDIILADGQSVVWASRILRKRLPERIAGIDLMRNMLHRSSQRGYRVYFLGAKEDVLNEAVSRLEAENPGLVVAGKRNGYFDSDDEQAIVEDIAQSRADILLVAMTSPKKEVFLAKWSKQLNVPVCHGVGGAFDVVAGVVQRAPQAWQNLGMEWLYRVVQEPRRMWRRYLITNTLFCVMVLGEFLRGLVSSKGRESNRASREVG